MALDNPSYFTIPGGNTTQGTSRSGRFSLLRRHVRMGTGSSTRNSSSASKPKKNERYSTPPTINPQPTGMGASAAVRDPSPDSLSQCRFRKSFRSLLRDPIQTQMLVLGMPRPSDVAPSHKQKTHFLKKDSGKSHNRNASTGKAYRMAESEIFGSLAAHKSACLQTNRGIGSLPSIDDGYYNVLSNSTVPQGKRRHSIGAYFTRKISNLPKETPQIEEETSFTLLQEDPRVYSGHGDGVHGCTRKVSTAKEPKKCSRCNASKGAKSSDMEDILIISSNRSQAADLWVQYLKTCFDQIRKNRSKPPFRILSLGIEDLGVDSLSPLLEKKLKSVKIAIMIVCPVFLEHVNQFPEHGSNLTKNFRPERVLAMLLGVEESAVTDDHKAGLLNYNQWKRMESVKDRDEKFVGDFLGVAMDIISKSSNQQVQNGEKCHFMLMPKKVNKSQNKVLILLNEPITKEDVIKVKVIRNNEAFEMPCVKKRNPYTVIFRIPEEFFTVSMLVNVSVERNGQDLGSKLLKCESQLYALDQILRSCDNPVEFMCQALNIVPCDKDKLDDFLVSAFQKNLPPNFNLLQTSGLGQLHRGVISKEEYPTLLHFAAKFGLEKLSWMLLECPGGELACDIRNICELTPSEMAESAGHSKLANALCGYMQMTEFTSVYTYLKGMSDDKQSISKSDCSDDYLNPRPVSETYQVPPSPRPLAQPCSQPPVGYMQMHSPKCMKAKSDSTSQNDDASSRSSSEKLKQRQNSTESSKKEDSDGSKRSRENSGNGIQEELIEIINDFKNNVFTISEVEKLVENWRNRNDVQQSFKEKQDQLMKMREEYERVQQKLKEEMKEVGRQSPMERLRNFFRGKVKEGKHAESRDSGRKTKQTQDTSLGNRPASSLSIQSISSSSSGRLSTGSHCSGMSLGDSGTHSDPESERKYRSAANGCCNHRRGKDIAENYDVPPSPVALLASKHKMSNGISNYDIPPVPMQSEFVCSRINGVHVSTPSPCVVEAQVRETFYYNLPSRDSPAPNESVLHNQLAKVSSRNCLQALEESAESKTDEKASPFEYMNLPNVDGRVTAKYVVIEDEEKLPSHDVNLPDYVNVEPPEVEISWS